MSKEPPKDEWLKAERLFLADFLQHTVALLNQRIAALDEEITKSSHAAKPNASAEFEMRLEAGPWKEAASRRCDYWRDAPADLVEKVRAAKGGLKGVTHHFTASTTEPTLFRFRRRSKT
jgi:uncharacterized small protein (DUF1192 family)